MAASKLGQAIALSILIKSRLMEEGICERSPAGSRRRIRFDLDEHRSDGYAVGIGMGLGVVVLAGQEGQPGVVLMAEDRGIGRGNDLVGPDLIDIALPGEVNDHQVPPAQGFQVDEGAGQAISSIDMAGEYAV